MNYEPEKSETDVIIKISGGIRNKYKMAEVLEEMLGCQLIGKWYSSDCFVYRTDDAHGAVEDFNKMEMVEWAETVDLKYERRREALEDAISELEVLQDTITEYPDTEYRNRINAIFNELDEEETCQDPTTENHS